jgi:hypothetical protein
VKKLMANLVFLGLSFGKIESNESRMVGSVRRSFSVRIPRCSDNSCTRHDNTEINNLIKRKSSVHIP